VGLAKIPTWGEIGQTPAACQVMSDASDSDSQQLSEDVTCLALRGLSKNCTLEQLLPVLDEVGGRYNFIHFPGPAHPDQIGPNIGLAFINFQDHERAALAFKELRRVQEKYSGTDCRYRRVSPSNAQGLGENLAHFAVSYFGHQISSGPKYNVPLVLDNGLLSSDFHAALRKYCTLDMILEAEGQIRKRNVMKEARQQQEQEQRKQQSTLYPPKKMWVHHVPQGHRYDFDTSDSGFSGCTASTASSLPSHHSTMLPKHSSMAWAPVQLPVGQVNFVSGGLVELLNTDKADKEIFYL